jgi:TM2 domain-containing membrane protein YozV
MTAPPSPPPDPTDPLRHGPPPLPAHVQPAPAYEPGTGWPYSDKSRVVAGLLQLLPAFFFCLGGVGRLYAGQTALGTIQLVSSITAWIMLVCLFWLIIPILLFGGVWLWGVIDGVIMLAGRPVDGYGRPLRP